MSQKGFILKISVTLGIILALVVAGILIYNQNREQTKPADTSKISVTASFYPLYYFAKEIGGDKVNVVNITPAGTEPHDFEPTATQIKDIYQSKLFLFNGAGLDTWASKIQPDLDKNNVTNVEITKGLTVLKPLEKVNENEAHEGEDEHAGEEGHKDDHEHEEFDPHLWLDPKLAIKQVETITENLIKVDSKNKAVYEQNSSKLLDKLNQLDQDFRQKLSKCEKNEIITSHNFMQYVAKNYGFKSTPISGISPDSEPSSQDLSQIAKIVKDSGLKYVFTESLISPKLSQTLAAETGAQTLVLNPIEGLSQEEINKGEDYISIQKQNLDNLKIALQCS
jgi:zinc transport system substrate-binding protein